MAKLVWDQKEQRRYEYGVDQGVFYPQDDAGVVWNGLVAVAESSDGGENTPLHYDGIKYLDSVEPRNYKSTITAYSTPTQFQEAEGDKSVVPGFILTRQPRATFGLSYRTFVEPSNSYKIHIIYNVLATSTGRPSTTIADTAEPAPFEWKLDAVPPVRSKYRPTAHYILDSLKMLPEALEILEEIIYGTDSTPPRLPDPDELENIVGNFRPLVIVPESVTGLSTLISGMGDLYRTEVEGIMEKPPETRLQLTLIPGLYRLEQDGL